MIYIETLPRGSKAPLKLWTDGTRGELDLFVHRIDTNNATFRSGPPFPHYLLPVHYRRRARIAGAVDAQPVLFLQCQRNLKPTTPCPPT